MSSDTQATPTPRTVGNPGKSLTLKDLFKQAFVGVDPAAVSKIQENLVTLLTGPDAATLSRKFRVNDIDVMRSMLETLKNDQL